MKNMSQMLYSVSSGRLACEMKMVRNHWKASRFTVKGGFIDSKCLRSFGFLRRIRTSNTFKSINTLSRLAQYPSGKIVSDNQQSIQKASSSFITSSNRATMKFMPCRYPTLVFLFTQHFRTLRRGSILAWSSSGVYGSVYVRGKSSSIYWKDPFGYD